MFLKDLGLSDSKAIFLQAFIFGAKHINYLFSSPFSFWLAIPLLGLILGIIVFRTKSLTVSTFVHLLYNIFAGFIVF